MSVLFSLCSINYLAQAKNLYQSVKATNPESKMIIGIVDQNTTNVDLSDVECELVFVDQIKIQGFEDMVHRYTIVELLTAVKPFYFLYLMERFKDEQSFFYFDPDIMLFNKLTKLEQELGQYDIILTPHMTAPINDQLLPTELHVKQTGIYNLGFLAVSRSENTIKMLKWWADRLRDLCYINFARGLFVDQLWMDLVPAYFDKVLISKYPGYNMAHWNLHERTLSKNGDTILVNNEPLIFYHFSHYKPNNNDTIAAFHTRFTLSSRPDLQEIFALYKSGLEKNKFAELIKTPCFYIQNEKGKKRKRDLENKMRILLPGKVKDMLKRFQK